MWLSARPEKRGEAILRAWRHGEDCQGSGDRGRRQQLLSRRESREAHWSDPFLVTLNVNNQARNLFVERISWNILRLPGLGWPVAQTANASCRRRALLKILTRIARKVAESIAGSVRFKVRLTEPGKKGQRITGHEGEGDGR